MAHTTGNAVPLRGFYNPSTGAYNVTFRRRYLTGDTSSDNDLLPGLFNYLLAYCSQGTTLGITPSVNLPIHNFHEVITATLIDYTPSVAPTSAAPSGTVTTRTPTSLPNVGMNEGASTPQRTNSSTTRSLSYPLLTCVSSLCISMLVYLIM
ncbi:hypothetical protein M427DRAFT_222035 [Gonapodya prolifera JEL478]|uniref:Uncharacterized protein n=1 Tax=Gonapodya prolifera (strain JEL478) TaxID=1344416 RepID=A0A139AN05_GONPJ|nr:hypothetical protein M427DRAFT_222035 [Gonapodya prolifera JEL478]|eukprot:KXS18098.1 hypothetical protein M427DRAFT_222035 [Gonapodya prolifera JEL478]